MAPSVLVVEDDAGLREALCETLQLADVPVCEAADGEQAMRRLDAHSIGLVVSDVQMQPMDGYTLLHRIRQHDPALPVVMMTAHATVERAVQAMREGADDYLVKPFDAARLVELARRFLRPASDAAEPIAADPASRRLLEMARRVAASDATVLLGGESGTGKEVLARHIHTHSSRAQAAFVAINCAAIPESMLEATLFGYEKGAYTGATTSHAGKFEQAQGGTLLLDEVSEMALALQAKLLRVLQEREVERLGGRASTALDVRVIATTNRDLAAEVAAGRFREDLYYRLNVFPLRWPPLRERRGDILPLARHLLAGHCRSHRRPTPRIAAEAERLLLLHPWPGNVRELDNLLQRALILSDGDVLQAGDLAFEAVSAAPSQVLPETSCGADLETRQRQNEVTLILDALRENDGNRRATAERLGVSERTLRYKLARLRAEGHADAIGC